MDSDEPLTSADAEALLSYAQVTYRAVTEQRRRLSAAFLAIAVLFGAIALVCAVQWAGTAAQIDEVRDAALIDTLGVRVPDPRPAFERTELRMRAFGWAVVTVGAGLIALIAAGFYALVRPSPLPPDLQALDRSPPPPGDVHRKSTKPAKGVTPADTAPAPVRNGQEGGPTGASYPPM